MRTLLLIGVLWCAAIALLSGMGMPFWEAVGLVTGAVAVLTVLTGTGLAVTGVVASVLLEYRSFVARNGLRNFGNIEPYPGKPEWRLEWRLEEAALRSYIFGTDITAWSLLAGMTATVGMLLPLEAVNWSDRLPESVTPAARHLAIAAITAAAAVLVFWHGRRSLRTRQEETCQAVIKKSGARWEELRNAAVPQLKELQSLTREIIAAGETAGWELTSKAFTREAGDRIWHDLGRTSKLDFGHFRLTANGTRRTESKSNLWPVWGDPAPPVITGRSFCNVTRPAHIAKPCTAAVAALVYLDYAECQMAKVELRWAAYFSMISGCT